MENKTFVDKMETYLGLKDKLDSVIAEKNVELEALNELLMYTVRNIEIDGLNTINSRYETMDKKHMILDIEKYLKSLFIPDKYIDKISIKDINAINLDCYNDYRRIGYNIIFSLDLSSEDINIMITLPYTKNILNVSEMVEMAYGKYQCKVEFIYPNYTTISTECYDYDTLKIKKFIEDQLDPYSVNLT